MALISIACAIVQCFIQTAGAQMKKKIASTRVVVRLLPDAPEWQKINSLRLPLTNDYTWENSSFAKPYFFGCTLFCSTDNIFRSMSHKMDFASKHTLVITIRQFFLIGRRRNWPHLIDLKIENNFGTNINWKILGGSKSLGSETWNFGGVFRCFADNSVVDTVLLRAAADSAPALSLNWLSKRETEMKWNKWNMNIFLFIFAATIASTSGESVIGEVMTEFEQTRCFVFV